MKTLLPELLSPRRAKKSPRVQRARTPQGDLSPSEPRLRSNSTIVKSDSARWRRLSTPDSIEPTDYNSVTVLKQRIDAEKMLLDAELKQLNNCDSESDEFLALEKRTKERTKIIQALENTLGVQENVVLTEGSIQFRLSSADDFVQAWCVIEFPVIKLYKKQTVGFDIYVFVKMKDFY